MTREERRQILGDEIVAHIHDLVAEAPEPPAEAVEKLRRIMTRPGGEVPVPRPAVPVEPAADAAA
ncbi:hypothetical protein [Streptomyces sp. LN704]|uniref:hypothetical protein n=1 Tax=Streptomyces sp. LN704 TaxID=3112982 RepID=UPI00371D0993